MNRLFGAQSKTPKPDLQSAIGNVDTRIESVDVKIAKLQEEMKNLPRLPSGKLSPMNRQRALKIVQQRKMYEAQRDNLQSQSWNMEQATMLQDNLKNTMSTVDAMKTTQKQLKKQYGKINIDKIERMQDDMADLMDMGNDIQEALSRSYDVPEEVDEEELDAELEAMENEKEFESMGMEGEAGLPSFMSDETSKPEFVDEPPEHGKVKEAAG